MALRDDQIDRYSRQILLGEVGGRGQERLLGSAAAILGAGSLARLCTLYLAGAGVGRLGLLLEDTSDGIETLDELSDLNSDVRVESLSAPTSFASPASHPADFDVWLDTRGAAAALAELVAGGYGGAVLAAGARGAQGWIAIDGAGGCAVCAALHESDEEHRQTGGAMYAATAGVIASLLAFEALARLLDWNDTKRGSWLHYDGDAMTLKVRELAAHPDCSACRGRSRPRV